MCESYVQEYSKPCSSAFFVRSTSRVYGGSGRTVTPNVRRAMGLRAYAAGTLPDNGPRVRCCENRAMITHFLAFLGVAAVVIVTPGQDTALTIRNTLLGGRRSGVLTACGVSTGQAIWALATSAGVAALLRASEPAFTAVQGAGAAHLVWLGLQTIFL